tara:strand:+ start:10734 stop:11711 length:978 start_codon:yes stop_codon:yes gene_type:complete
MKNILKFLHKDKKVFEILNIYNDEFQKTQKSLFYYKKDENKYESQIFNLLVADNAKQHNIQKMFEVQINKLIHNNETSISYLFEKICLSLIDNKKSIRFNHLDFFIPRFVSNDFIEKGYIPKSYIDNAKKASREKEVKYFNKEKYDGEYSSDFFLQSDGYYNFSHWYNQTILFFLEKYNKYQKQKAFAKTFNSTNLKTTNNKFFEIVDLAYKETHLRLDTLKRYLEGCFLIYLPEELFVFDINDIEQADNTSDFFQERFKILNILVYIAQNYGDSPEKIFFSDQFTNENKKTIAKYQDLLYNNTYFDKKNLNQLHKVTGSFGVYN